METSLETIEQLMVMVPNFQPRKSDIVINNYFNCRGGDEDCRIGVINIDDSCGDCVSDDWNFKVNVDKKNCKDLVMDCFSRIKNKVLKDRLGNLANNFKEEVFLNYQHK